MILRKNSISLRPRSSGMMEKDTDRAKTFTRRAFVVGTIQGGLLMLLGGRLAWLQIAEGVRYKTLAEDNRINVKMIAPGRGQIVDRFGVPLALNTQNFRVLVVPEQTDDLEKALRALHKVVPIEEREIAKVLKQAKRSPEFAPLEVRDNLNWEQVAAIEVNLPDLPGLSIDVGEIRSYPLTDATAHLIGYVGAVNESEMTDDPILKLPGFRIGKAGIEKSFDGPLRGSPGNVEVEVNVVGREVRELKRQVPTPGKRLVLSIDAELQRYTQQRLSETRSASAVIMDSHTGAVYALASYPSFDPNNFTRGISAERWEELLADPASPLNNKAVSGQYPPGSTFKMVTALAALEAKVAHRGTSVYCPGHYEYGNGRFHCWKPEGHGTVNIISALAESCDTYFYKLSTDIGIDNIAVMARKLGLGEKFGFELPEERPGLIPDAKWKKANRGESWQPGETIVAAIGQGYTLATPLQLAVMTSRLVNGGYAVKPWVAARENPPTSEKDWPLLGIKKEHLEMIMEGMDAVVGGERGTARGAQIKVEGMEMGGKTGTAQVKRITMRERAMGIKNENLPWKYRHHALFVGYAPVSNPRYVCSVVVEHGGGGSAVAAPVARDLLLMAQKRNPAASKMYQEEQEAKTAPAPKAAPKKMEAKKNG